MAQTTLEHRWSTLELQWSAAEAQTAVLYGLIADLRRAYPTRSAAKTLDLVVRELGRTQENLRDALARLETEPLPAGGKAVLDELERRAREEDVDDIGFPLPPDELEQVLEPIDGGEIGIAVILGFSTVVILGLGLFLTVIHPAG